MNREQGLCEVCKTIDFDKFFNIPVQDCHPEHLEEVLPNHTRFYGTYKDIESRSKNCPICSFLKEAWMAWEKVSNRPTIPKPDDSFNLRRWLPRNGITGWNDFVGVSMKAMTAGCARFERTGDSSGPIIAFDPTPHSKYKTNGRFRTLDPEILDGGQADFRIIKTWLDDCEKHHFHLCKRQAPSPQDDRGQPAPKRAKTLNKYTLDKLRLVDVKTQEILLVDFENRYVALSYVWDQAGYSESVPRWAEQDGRLYLPSSIPQTIKDALIVVQRLGERYLWVDAYCIDQHDESELLKVINKIDVIFEMAYVTICAAGNGNSSPGLHGISLPIRRTKQVVRDCELGTFKTVTLPRIRELSQSIWNRRAWTMEEAVLSRRCLLLQPTRTVLWCNTSVYMEFADCPGNARVVWGVTTSSIPFAFQMPTSGAPWNFELWNQILEAFTSRDLTYQSDAMRALAGLRNQISKNTNTPIPFGLPLSRGVCTLLWKTIPGRECTRRLGFPSWSWLGWHCPAAFDHWLMPTSSAEDIYQFMLPTAGLSTWGSRNPETFGYRCVKLCSEAKILTAPTQDLSSRKGALLRSDYELRIRSESALFEVRRFNHRAVSEDNSGSQLWRLYDARGSPVGLINGHNILGEHRLHLVLPRDIPDFDAQHLEFILIQHWKETAPLQQRYGDVVTAIAVTRSSDDGKATRIGSTAVPYRDWHADVPKTVDICIL